MTSTAKPTTMPRRLRELLARPQALMAPGAADALTARLVARQGFEAIYMSGAGTTAVRLGMPDIGLLTMGEMADNAQRIAEASGLPLVADADTGYGGVMNVRRTVRAYERAGVAGIHIEDQQWPKRCGHLAGKSVTPVGDMVSKVKAATDARHDDDFVIIARTDALAVEGFEAAMARCQAYAQAGADMIFMEAPSLREHLEAVPRQIKVLAQRAPRGCAPSNQGAHALQHGVQRQDTLFGHRRDWPHGLQVGDLPQLRFVVGHQRH